MTEENRHMDDAFKRLEKEFKVTYNTAFWNEAKAKLDDTLLDDAFKAAAAGMVTSPSFEPTESIDDMFMDSAFVDAAVEQSAVYDPAFFEQFMANEGDIAMDEAFVEAAGATVVDYLPEYWDDADEALKNEGLHYEYRTEYWNEAKRLLDKRDRRIFFLRWSAAATFLLLFSMSGMYLSPDHIEVNTMQAHNVSTESVHNENNHLTNVNIDAIKEALIADKEFNGFSELTDLDLSNMQYNVNGSEMQDYIVNSDGFTLATSNTPTVNTEIETFKSLEINAGLAENNKTADEQTFMYQGEHINTPINRLAFSVAFPEPEIKIEKPEPKTIHTFGLVAETGVGNKWGDFSFLPTLRNGFGIEYSVAPGRKELKNFEFGSTFKINHIRQNQLNAEERSNVYDVHGDVTKYWRKLQLKDMVYANLSGHFNYRVAPRHKFKFGVGVEYLMAVRSNMSYVDDFTGSITTVNHNWGVKEGLNKFDLRFSVGYEYQLDKYGKWAMQLTSNLGTFDRTDDDFIGDINRDVELNLMLGLKYNLFGFKK